MRNIFRGLLTLVMVCSFFGVSAFCDPTTGGLCGTCEPCPSNTCDSTCNTTCKTTCKGTCDGYPFLAYRSQSVNAARELVGWQPFVNRYDMEEMYGAFSIAFEYTRSFKPERISQFLFGDDLVNCNTLLIQGSRIENRDSHAWLADYFGLPVDFSSKVSFCPRIENFLVDLNFYLGLDELTEGIYFRIHAPIVHTRWNLNLCETVEQKGELGFPVGYMHEGPENIDRNSLPANFTQAVNGNVTFGDMKAPLRFGRMANCRLTKTRLSDIQLAFGWNFLLNEDYHLGILIRASAPTGNRPNSCYLFEPIVGNGKHWELGGGISGSWIFWRSEETEDHYAGVWLDANVTHLFKTCQCRSFDFCKKPNSRYMLLAEMDDPNAEDNLRGGPGNGTVPDENQVTDARYQYQKNLIPAINWSTFNVDVRIDAQVDAAIKLSWTRKRWSVDLGYNVWARTGEKFCITDCCCDDDCCCACPDLSGKKFSIKGDATLYGYIEREVTEQNRIAISSSQCKADINTGINMTLQDADALANRGVDNEKLAWAGNMLDDKRLHTPNVVFAGEAIEDAHLYSSFPPKLVSRSDLLNLCNSPSSLTHKVFAHVNYTWKDKEEDWVPFVGVGGEAEFDTKCTTRRGVSQWGLWFKGGVAVE